MKLNLTPKEIHKQFVDGTLDKNSAYEALKWIVENEPDEEVRINGIEILGQISYNTEEMYKFLENVILSDSNAYIRYAAVKVMIFNFPNRCIDPIKWIAEHEQSPYILKTLYDLVIKPNSWSIPKLKEELKKGFESRFGVSAREVEVFLELEFMIAGFYSEHRVNVSYFDELGTEDLKDFFEGSGRKLYVVRDKRIVALDLSSKRIKALPLSLRALTKLTTLDISDTDITKIPDGFSSLLNLQLIGIRAVPLESIPEWLFHVASKVIAQSYIKAGVHQKDAMVLGLLENLSGRKLTKLGEDEPFFKMNKDMEFGYKINQKGHVVGLAIYDTSEGGYTHTLPMLPGQISHLEYLEEIYFINGTIQVIPDSLCTLKRLRRIDLSYNAIKLIPKCIGELHSMEFLKLEFNRIRRLPETIGMLESLRELNIKKNRIQELPHSTGGLKKLKDLDLSSNRIQAIPESIGFLNSLEKFNLSENRIESLPDSVAELGCLKSLLLSNNRIRTFPEVIIHLPSLKSLGLGGNQIRSVPESISSLSSLNGLNLSENGLKKIPESLKNMKSLTNLNLERNKFQTIPECITSLSGLKSLILSGNEIKEIPESLKNLEILDFLNLENNNIKEIPKFIRDMKSRGLYLVV